MNNQQRRLRFAQAAGVFVHALVAAAAMAVEPILSRQPYHTSILTGEGWVQELLAGHPEGIHTELGVHLHVFHQLVETLKECGMGPSKWISLEEKLAIFLYASVTGLSIRHLGE
jgi:hypothetical protein